MGEEEKKAREVVLQLRMYRGEGHGEMKRFSELSEMG